MFSTAKISCSTLPRIYPSVKSGFMWTGKAITPNILWIRLPFVRKLKGTGEFRPFQIPDANIATKADDDNVGFEHESRTTQKRLHAGTGPQLFDTATRGCDAQYQNVNGLRSQGERGNCPKVIPTGGANFRKSGYSPGVFRYFSGNF